ncbi:hypothetical protein DL89DRAFT_118205 [Linderina pennispora]|uniref:Uncharacterized protein n=1 Tax=Linderina pennispora TaxID=61395 RepID=A0A1Y1VX48_9FUNG|nr:uncharacterized protein DL89DRAFT_118205 [Linderina pennispora]ORX65314.1 hypothetical protein DL89DRAFT_118205 [Linderina pennispora]
MDTGGFSAAAAGFGASHTTHLLADFGLVQLHVGHFHSSALSTGCPQKLLDEEAGTGAARGWTGLDPGLGASQTVHLSAESGLRRSHTLHFHWPVFTTAVCFQMSFVGATGAGAGFGASHTMHLFDDVGLLQSQMGHFHSSVPSEGCPQPADGWTVVLAAGTVGANLGFGASQTMHLSAESGALETAQRANPLTTLHRRLLPHIICQGQSERE